MPSLAEHDAISSHVRNVAELLRSKGLASEIFADRILDNQDDVAHQAETLDDVSAGPSQTMLIHQLSIGGDFGHWVAARPEPKIINYHNITPSVFFERWFPEVAWEVAAGRWELEQYAHGCAMAVTPSEFNRRELTGLGYDKTAVAPILFDPAAFSVEPDSATTDLLTKSDKKQLLFVGRVSPNKCQHSLVLALKALLQMETVDAELHIVGNFVGAAYKDAIDTLIDDLDLTDAVHVHGPVSQAELKAFYMHADVFVCLSEHEGFCVPLVEAMHHGIPIIALRAAAVPETVADAAVLIPTRAPTVAAAAINVVLNDDDLAERLIAAGRRRMSEMSLDRSREAFWKAVEQVLVAS